MADTFKCATCGKTDREIEPTMRFTVDGEDRCGWCRVKPAVTPIKIRMPSGWDVDVSEFEALNPLDYPIRHIIRMRFDPQNGTKDVPLGMIDERI